MIAWLRGTLSDKRQIHAMVRVLLPKADPESDDAADALAIAICHARHGHTAALLEPRRARAT